MYVDIQFSQHRLSKRLSCSDCVFLVTLSKLSVDLEMCGFTWGPTIPFQWSICLFQCQYHTVSIIINLKYVLESRNVMSSALFFFLKTALAMWGLKYEF